ncbi:MAG TPA: spondin domain-containing protein [Candidatus Binataceae bacterium]|nr:spondin domain-containing protein [Candidatus Binataceae bacterium]
MKSVNSAFLPVVALVLTSLTGRAIAGEPPSVTYQVTVTSLTGGAAGFNHAGEPGGEYFAPIFMLTQDSSVTLFTPGQPPSLALAEVAEAGNPTPLVTQYTGNSHVGDIVTTSPLPSGQSKTFTIQAAANFHYFSIAAMLFPTNDEFMGLSIAALPLFTRTETYYVNAWDADSKPDDELCANMAPSPDPSVFPVPECSGPQTGFIPPVPSNAEVHISNGIHGIGSIPADVYDWRNPVAVITITNQGLPRD